MKSPINLLFSVGLLLCLCSCGGGKHQPKHIKSKKTEKVAQIDMSIIGDNKETSEMLAFSDDTDSFENIESFVLEEDGGFGSFSSLELNDDNNELLTLNDPSNINFSWEAIQEEAQEAFQTVYFGYDNSCISQDERTKVAKNVEYANKLVEEGKTIVCKGKACNWGGTEVYNLAISDQRAQSVACELKVAGISEDYIKAFGVGTKESLICGNAKADHAVDRCVELYTLTI